MKSKNTRKHQSNLKRNKELEISHSENYSEEEQEQNHNQTSERSPPSHKIQNYPYNYFDSSDSENYNSSSNADQAGETDTLANLWYKMFKSAAKSPHILASNFQKKN